MEKAPPMRVLKIILLAASTATSLQAQTKPPHARPQPESFHASMDGNLHPYKPAGHFSGSLRAVQSDTTPGLVELWIKGFAKYHPDVSIKADIEGSGAAGLSLTSGTADFGIIAREMMPKEEVPFETKFGYKPLEIAVAGGSFRTLAFTDALTFFVHKDNPLEKLSFAQLDAIYSKTRSRKY